MNVGDEIGEHSILKNYKRYTNAWVYKKADLLYIEKYDIENFIKEYELRRITESINFLKSIPCFHELTNKRIKTLIESSKVVLDHKRSSYIIKEGMPI